MSCNSERVIKSPTSVETSSFIAPALPRYYRYRFVLVTVFASITVVLLLAFLHVPFQKRPVRLPSLLHVLQFRHQRVSNVLTGIIIPGIIGLRSNGIE